MTQTQIIEKMGVNNNTFRRFMNPKTYKDQRSLNIVSIFHLTIFQHLQKWNVLSAARIE